MANSCVNLTVDFNSFGSEIKTVHASFGIEMMVPKSVRFWRRRQTDVSVVVVAYNMAREMPRTLLSLSASYQRDISAEHYEVIVVDNGSNPPLDPATIGNLKGNFQLIRIDPAPPSPAYAINRGLAAARGKTIGVMIDGARIVTPGLLHFARQGVHLYQRAVVATLAWHLGPDIQELDDKWLRQATRRCTVAIDCVAVGWLSAVRYLNHPPTRSIFWTHIRNEHSLPS
jgi:glycosyltransferase involved in cell wall biosynthesis